MLDAATLAYVAGIIDVQGRITCRFVGSSMLPQIAVSSTNAALVKWLGDLTGVKPVVTKRSYLRHACDQHCPQPHQHISSQSGRWLVAGAKATVVIRAVRPYLRLQTGDADAVLAVAEVANYKPATFEKMRLLGWPVNYVKVTVVDTRE